MAAHGVQVTPSTHAPGGNKYRATCAGYVYLVFSRVFPIFVCRGQTQAGPALSCREGPPPFLHDAACVQVVLGPDVHQDAQHAAEEGALSASHVAE